MEPNYIHTPSFKILQIFFSKTIISVKVVEIGVEWIDFIDHIYSVINSITIVLINEHGVIRIDLDRTH